MIPKSPKNAVLLLDNFIIVVMVMNFITIIIIIIIIINKDIQIYRPQIGLYESFYNINSHVINC